ncbi:6-phosphogluconolactonase [Microbacterium limosum]|uniref:6-phosphogluconolactonase n=1 Tax=Microbacterium limosum TaxID=3079935 RepID=A0AAU0MDY5_9MICO|nr:6-phosphogluconolactonase [Microbacterium sp. Y20]WOQ68487.1 6-phosphogluconolactonase [Microbacterium sp. Y20]
MSSELSAERRVVVSADRATVVDVVSRRLLDKLTRLTNEKERVHLALTGGGAGIGVLAGVADHPARDQVDWSRVHFWWSDERFVPQQDAERNDLQARAALLDVLDVPEENIHSIASTDSGLSAEEAAERYSEELARFADDTSGLRWPSFDVCLLGVGPDAHIASLFPDRDEIRVSDSGAVAVHDSPKPPPTRVTLTRPVINASQRVWLVLTGAEKASALGLALAGASYLSVPAAGAKGRRSTLFFVDVDAAAEVPEELIDPD